MKIDKIIFVQTFPTGQFQNQKLGMEVIIEPHDFMDGEIPQIKVAKEAFEFAKKAVAEAFNAMNPHIGELITHSDPLSFFLRDEAGATKAPTPPPVIDRKAIQRIEILIDDAKTKDELAAIWDKAVDFGLKDFYESKLKQLS